MTYKQLVKKFEDIEGPFSHNVAYTDNPSWWEGYASALVDTEQITEKIFDRFIEFLKTRT
jgi:hypothetical protein